MKITTFNPHIITKDAESVVKLFEELGFQKRHDRKDIGDYKVEGIRMKDAGGFYVDIAEPEIDLPRDLVAIRMNVDDFDEAYELLKARGFRNFYGDKLIESKSAKSAMMVSESGLGINLIQHIK
ncbi:MAG: VOC family protein [Clostridia bacterium]|nr:VOC family protein [Clostridia bacterium]